MEEKVLFLNIYKQAYKNASELLSEAKILQENEKYARAYFLAYSCLEEIAKSQFAADVSTGFTSKEEFKGFYRDHSSKNKHMGWMHKDASSFPYNQKWIGPDKDDIEIMDPRSPLFQKRQSSLYVDIDFNNKEIFLPKDKISKEESEEIIHIADTAFERIWEVTEHSGNQIGSKGFLK